MGNLAKLCKVVEENAICKKGRRPERGERGRRNEKNKETQEEGEKEKKVVKVLLCLFWQDRRHRELGRAGRPYAGDEEGKLD